MCGENLQLYRRVANGMINQIKCGEPCRWMSDMSNRRAREINLWGHLCQPWEKSPLFETFNFYKKYLTSSFGPII